MNSPGESHSHVNTEANLAAPDARMGRLHKQDVMRGNLTRGHIANALDPSGSSFQEFRNLAEKIR